MKKLITMLPRKVPAIAALVMIALTLGLGRMILGSVPAAWRRLRSSPATDPHLRRHNNNYPLYRLSAEWAGSLRRSQFRSLASVVQLPANLVLITSPGVTGRSTNLLGVLMALLFASSLLLLFSATRWSTALVVFLAIFSGPVLFAMERGNIDQVLFALLVCGFFMIERTRDSARTFFQCSLIVLLTSLKIFPIAAVVVLLRNRQRFLIAAFAVVVSVAALLASCGRIFLRCLQILPGLLG